MKNKVNAISQGIIVHIPNLRKDLEGAGIKESPIGYISSAITKASLASLATAAASAAIFTINGKPKPTVSIILAVFAFAFILAIYLHGPRQTMRTRATRLEQNLIFSLHAINIEMESGIKFGQAIQDIAEKDYGEFSGEMRRVLEETHKYGISEALERSAQRNPSKVYRRFIWQMINSIETGADIHSNIKAIINDLRRQQENDALKYGRTMEKQMTLYIMGGIVLPALSIVVIQTITSMGLTKNDITESTYWLILALSMTIQVAFLYIIKFRKPTLLCEPETDTRATGGIIQHIQATLLYAGVQTPWKTYVASKGALALALGIIIALAIKAQTHIGYPILIAISSTFTAVTVYTHLAYRADLRGIKATEYLPDSLRIMAANMQAGISPEQALYMSAKTEFSVLGREIRTMGEDMMKNLTFEEALEKLKGRIKSESLHQSINLISHGLKAGRGLSGSLYHIADILQDREYVRQNISTNLAAVRTTVLMLVIISAPLLYSCAIVSAHVMGQFNERLNGSLPEQIIEKSWIKPAKAQVSVDFLNQYIMVNLIVTSLLGAIIIGEVTTGKAKEGLRYMFIMALASEILYIALKTFLMDKVGGAFA
jgi:Flp pilus assembly protein TadB